MRLIIILTMLPLWANAQWEMIAKELCEKEKRALIIFYTDGQYGLVESIKKEMSGKDYIVYSFLGFDWDIAKDVFKVKDPYMYALDRNMFVLKSEKFTRKGWSDMKGELGGEMSKDCLPLPEEKKDTVVISEFPIVIPETKPVLEEEQKKEKKEKPVEKVAAAKKEEPKAEPKKEQKPQAKAVPRDEDFKWTTGKESVTGGDDNNSDVKVDGKKNEKSYYTVQLGVYEYEKNAAEKQKSQAELKAERRLVYIPRFKKDMWVVTAGRFANFNEAKQWSGRIGGFPRKIN